MHDTVGNDQPLKQRDERFLWNTDRPEAGRTMMVVTVKV